MIVREHILRRVLRSVAFKAFCRLENDGDCNFEKNGEKRFISTLFDYLKENTKGEATVFDVGANVGEYSRMLIDKSGKIGLEVKIHLFEPTEGCFEILKKRFVDTKGVFLNKKAVSDRTGRAEIFYNENKSSFASLYKRNLSSYSIIMDKSEVVETVRLDSYIKENAIDHIHFLKMDVEGHELKAFKGFGDYLKGDCIDFIQFEYGGANLDSHSSLIEFFDLFESAGFEMAKVMPRGLEIRSYRPWMDNFQYANYVAISKKVIERIR